MPSVSSSMPSQSPAAGADGRRVVEDELPRRSGRPGMAGGVVGPCADWTGPLSTGGAP
jgi:hypothetical protein